MATSIRKGRAPKSATIAAPKAAIAAAPAKPRAAAKLARTATTTKVKAPVSRAAAAPAPTKTPRKRAAAAAKSTPAPKRAARASPDLVISSGTREAMIAEAAHFIFQARGFAPGDPAQDWLVAEAEIDALLLARAR